MMMFQRNVFLALTFLMAISVAAMAFFLSWKNERVVVVPSIVEKEFWVDSNAVSATYLEQFGSFLGQLILTKSAQTAGLQRGTVLRHTDPSFATQLSKKLLEEEQKLLRENVSYVFFPKEVKTDPKTREVLLVGSRSVYINGNLLSTEEVSFSLKFNFTNSRLLLNGIAMNEETR